MKKLIPLILVIITVVSAVYVRINYIDSIAVKASMNGTVSWTIEPGAEVRTGSELVRITSLTGEVAGARANTSGKVRQVLVKVNDELKSGMVVARIERP